MKIKFFSGKTEIATLGIDGATSTGSEFRQYWLQYAKMFINPRIDGLEIITH